jgi:hypothetical protein
VVYRGLSLPQSVINEWVKSKLISLDGYSSTSMDEKIAYSFANSADSEGDKQKVLLKISIKNETGKHYFPFFTSDFSLYTEEKEVLL